MWAHLARYKLVRHEIFWHGRLKFSVVNRDLSEHLMKKTCDLNTCSNEKKTLK
jgi:hypothetical protein